MQIIYKLIFKIVPIKYQKYLGKSKVLKPIRNLVFRSSGSFNLTFVDIHKKYLSYDLSFRFFASPKIAYKAKKRGVENTLLTNSIKLLHQYKKRNDDYTIFDIGTNFGYLSMVWGLSVSKRGMVHGFEVNKKVHDALRKTINYNGLENIVLNYTAVGETNDTVKIYDMDTTSNIVNLNKSSNFDLVEMVNLDTYFIEKKIERCDLVKIDVDGIEYEILKGSLNLLKKLKPFFIVETNDDHRIIDFFNENNYTIFDMQLHEYDGIKEIPLNIFCIPNTL